ncbi:MAG: HD domain-containing protein [Acidimicrobiales bacterium]
MTDRDQVDEVFALFTAGGSSSYDEAVTMTEHCIQTAALGIVADADPELVAAALLHDIGHFLLADSRESEDFLQPDWDHDQVGAVWLRPRFGERVADAVGSHVDAKRYLCAVEPGYHSMLSEASKASLEIQGGPFSPVEAQVFAALPGAADAVSVRRWDDDGKVAGLSIPDLADFRPMLLAVAREAASAR